MRIPFLRLASSLAGKNIWQPDVATNLSVQCPLATTLNHTTSNWVSSVTLVSRLKERLLSLKSSGVWPFSNWTFLQLNVVFFYNHVIIFCLPPTEISTSILQPGQPALGDCLLFQRVKGGWKKKRSFYAVRLTVRGEGGSDPSALTVSKCENFGPISPIIKW